MQHDGLERAAAELTANEELLAYLDDLYVITSSAISARTKPVAEFGEEVWRSDRTLPERGFTAFGADTS